MMTDMQMSPETSLLTTPPTIWYDRLATAIADRSSPILIKECRQALKSRQFLWTFILLLVATLVWSYWGLSITLDRGLEESGPFLLAGYIFILSFPLAIVVPFSCFRSLAREFEDDTIHLMTITTMTPYKIVNGKMVSAALQMVLYLAAVTPAIAFTYLLRGVDISQILVLIVCVVVGSLSLSAASLMLGGLTKSVFFRVILTVGTIIGLVIAYVLWCMLLPEGVGSGFLFAEPEWMTIVVMILLWIGSTGWVCYHASASLISFPADDRSSRVRKAIWLQHMLLMASVFCPWLAFGDGGAEVAIVLLMISAHYWLIVGSMLSAENPGMSQRVRRSLPKSTLGKTFYGLLMPGPGRGYLFALTNLWGWTMLIILLFPILGELVDWFVSGGTTETISAGLALTIQTTEWSDASIVLAVNAAHASMYLSLSFVLIMLIRGKNRKLSPLVGLITLVFLFVFIHVASMSLHFFVASSTAYGYAYDTDEMSVYLSGNWWWWLSSIMDNFPVRWANAQSSSGMILSSVVVSFAAFLSTVVCCRYACVELIAPPSPIPARVLEEMQKKKGKLSPGESIEDIFAARRAGTGD